MDRGATERGDFWGFEVDELGRRVIYRFATPEDLAEFIDAAGDGERGCIDQGEALALTVAEIGGYVDLTG